MTDAVIDASVAVKWFLEEDRSGRARELTGRLDGLFAPTLLVAEVVHALWVAARAGRTAPEIGTEAIDVLRALFRNLTPDLDLIEEATQLARRLQHPVYDCLYVALASRRGLPLVTADERLHAAGRRARIPVQML